jgi:hypothetical protein
MLPSSLTSLVGNPKRVQQCSVRFQFVSQGGTEVRSRNKILLIEHVDDEFNAILKECERWDIEILALLLNLYRKGDVVQEISQHDTIVRADRNLRKRIQQWVEKNGRRIKEKIDWEEFQTPYQGVRTRLKFLIRFRERQFDAAIPGVLEKMRRWEKRHNKART